MSLNSRPLSIGLCGAGIGGVAAAISLKKNGGDDIRVTILEAASELGEIGAGIQMTPNVSRLLIRWGVDKVIGENLVEFDELNMRDKHGRKVGYAAMNARAWAGSPWWVVHRMHLHDGLVKVAKDLGVELVTGARVSDIDHTSSSQVKVKTEAGGKWTFDLLIGSDGLNSIVRKAFLPNVKPHPPTGNAAYRAIVPMDKIRADPATEHLAKKSQMDLWMGSKQGKEHGYVITYPISGGKDFNMVLEHHRPDRVYGVEDVTLDHVLETYKEYDPAIVRAIEMIDHPMKRWPLMVTVCPKWASPDKKLVLMGDAAHSMVNHMAQGAATSMEDGGFLGIILSLVAKGRLGLDSAIEIYERERMPLADVKQQVSYLNGLIYHMEDDSPAMHARNKAMEPELKGEMLTRTPNLYADPWTWRTVYEYDPEAHAHRAVAKHLAGIELRDSNTFVTNQQADTFVNWFLPEGSQVKARL